jgi:hypothetical protein
MSWPACSHFCILDKRAIDFLNKPITGFKNLFPYFFLPFIFKRTFCGEQTPRFGSWEVKAVVSTKETKIISNVF